MFIDVSGDEGNDYGALVEWHWQGETEVLCKIIWATLTSFTIKPKQAQAGTSPDLGSETPATNNLKMAEPME
jgi:hypothetical protein